MRPSLSKPQLQGFSRGRLITAYQKFTDIGYQNKNALAHECSFTSCYAEIDDWTDQPIRKTSNNCKTDSSFWSIHYICSSKTQICTQGSNTYFLSGAYISTHLDLDNDRGTQQTFPFTSEHLDSAFWTEKIMQCTFKQKEIWHQNNHNIDELSTDLSFSCSEKYPGQQVCLSSVNQHSQSRLVCNVAMQITWVNSHVDLFTLM